jgi:hypothetical protein
MAPLPPPDASPPILFGQPAPAGALLPWQWAQERLTTARNYWIATVRDDGRPHVRPVWGVWLPTGFWFSTGSLARHNLVTNPEISVHLEDGDEVVVVEGTGAQVASAADLQPMCDDYNPKYGWSLRPDGDGVVDASGTGGPVYRVTPRVVFGWERNMARPTRWAFAA